MSYCIYTLNCIQICLIIRYITPNSRVTKVEPGGRQRVGLSRTMAAKYGNDDQRSGRTITSLSQVQHMIDM